MRRYDGCYSMWPGERASWMAGSFFAWHFLLEAELAGYPLPEEEKRQIVTLLRRYVNDRGNSAEERGYACYLLALADPASAEAPARAVISENPELFSRFLAGAALIRANFAADGARVIGPLLNHPFHLYSRRSGGALDSEERRLGLALWILGDPRCCSRRSVPKANGAPPRTTHGPRSDCRAGPPAMRREPARERFRSPANPTGRLTAAPHSGPTSPYRRSSRS